MLLTLVAVQARMGQPLTLAEKLHIYRQRPDLVCLPEYYLLGDDIADHQCAALKSREHLRYLAELSDDLATCLVAGSVVEARGEHIHNAAYVFDRGKTVGVYLKRHPVPGELQRGVTPGRHNTVIDLDGFRLGLMICGDVFHPEMFDELREFGVDVICIPTTSPYRADDTPAAREQRDRDYFVAGARRAGAYVAKACGIGRLFGKSLQGRSLIAAPWGVLRRADEHAQDSVRILTEVLDIDGLKEFRDKASRLAAVEWHQGRGLSASC
jgi:predicted amidohydrolase